MGKTSAPSRFGDGNLHESDLLRALGTEMHSHLLKSKSFLIALIDSEVFQGWFRLSMLDDAMVKWFHGFVAMDENEFDAVCQEILRKHF